jgi:hypothetical protein
MRVARIASLCAQLCFNFALQWGCDSHLIHCLLDDERNGGRGLKPVLEVFDLPAPYRPFNPMFQGQLSGDDFTNSSTRQEPGAVFGRIAPYLTFVGLTTTLTVT